MSSCGHEDGQLSQEQLESLERNFKDCKHPDKTTLMLFAAEAGLTEEATKKWFQNRLSKWRRSEGLPSEIGSVMD
ncbi:homeodomain-only protein [Gastrophryne carolinensis]